MEYYQAIKKDIQPLSITWMDVEGILLSEISQTENTYMWNLKNEEPTLIDTENRLVVARGGG